VKVFILMPLLPAQSYEAAQGVEPGNALQRFASTVSLAQHTRRAVEMFKKKKVQAGLDTIVIVPISPVPPPSSSTVGPSDVSDAGGATNMKPGDFVKSRRKVVKQELVHKVGDKVEGLYKHLNGDFRQAWAPAVVTAVNGDGTCTLKWDDGDTTQTLKKSTGEIRGPNAVVTITSTFDDTLYCAVVKAKLTDVFKEADADKDGKLTYDEWKTRMGKLVSADELKRLFEECDTDKNGSLDTKEFATGMAGKYEIQWAQVCISSSLPSPAPPVYHHFLRPAVLVALICMRGPNKSVYMRINFRIPKRTTSEMRRI